MGLRDLSAFLVLITLAIPTLALNPNMDANVPCEAWDANHPCPCSLPPDQLRPAANIVWRVSVKVLLDEYGQRPGAIYSGGHCGNSGDPNGDLNTNDKIYAAFERANTILSWYGRGYQFVVDEPVELWESNLPAPIDIYCDGEVPCDPNAAGCSQITRWFDLPSRCAQDALTDAIAACPKRWAWDNTALNVYITGAASSGTGGRLGTIPGDGKPALMGQTLTECNTPFHEILHMFHVSSPGGLCHTHGCEFGTGSTGCGGGDRVCTSDSDCPLSDCTNSDSAVGDDIVCDTLLDNSNWCWNEMANNNFGTTSLTTEQTQQMCDTFYNMMSYHVFSSSDDPNDDWDYTFLTQGQLDALTDISNSILVDQGVATGRTRVVDAYAATSCPADSGVQDGSCTAPFHSLDDALAAADPGDIVLSRAGAYRKPSSPINQLVILRAAKGNVRIGALP